MSFVSQPAKFSTTVTPSDVTNLDAPTTCSPEISKEKIIPADGGVNFGGSSRLIFVPVGGVGTNDSDRISVGVSRKVGVS